MDDRAPNKRQKRRAVACETCNKQKIKCSGELPCGKCETAKKSDTCRYPVRDRNVTAPESYLEAVESELSILKATSSANPQAASVEPSAQQGTTNHSTDPDVANPLLDIQNGLFDRMIASKLGYPLSISDEDIDVEMPSMDTLYDQEQTEFSDPVPLRAHVGLARITGCILSDIDSIPKHQKETFPRRVYRVHNDLRRWDAELPESLRLKAEMPPRNLFTLHMHYHLCIIQTTRPILLYLFKTKFRPNIGSEPVQQPFSPLTLALADACVQSARTTNQLLSKLFIEGNLAVFDYFDAHYLFSSTLILIISACMNPATSTSEAVATALSLLKAMADNGNIFARDYLGRLEHIRRQVSNVRSWEEARQDHSFNALPQVDVPIDPAQSLGGVGTTAHRHHAAAETSVESLLSGDNFLHDDPLGNPFIESFLAEKAFSWPDGPSPDQDIFRQFAHELEDEFVFGS